MINAVKGCFNFEMSENLPSPFINATNPASNSNIHNRPARIRTYLGQQSAKTGHRFRLRFKRPTATSSNSKFYNKVSTIPPDENLFSEDPAAERESYKEYERRPALRDLSNLPSSTGLQRTNQTPKMQPVKQVVGFNTPVPTLAVHPAKVNEIASVKDILAGSVHVNAPQIFNELDLSPIQPPDAQNIE
jgi:hypothetical protein